MHIIDTSDSKYDILTVDDTCCNEDDRRATDISAGGFYCDERKGCRLGRRYSH